MAVASATRADNRFLAYVRFIKIEHSLFALPLILAATLLGFEASGVDPVSRAAAPTWGLVVVAAVTARTAAMALNRIIDRRIDAINPRTATRELPAGRLHVAEAWILVLAGFAGLLWAAWMLNPLCLALAPVLIVLFTAYPYAKRWTWAAHFFLGAAWACGPAGGYVAVTGSFAGGAAVGVLSLAALLWVAGFDVVYALLDVRFDRASGLHSIPARFGEARALVTARGLHLGVVAAFAAFGVLARLSWPYWPAWAAIAALLHVEHAHARSLDPGAINRAFFNVNAGIGWILLAGVVGGQFA